MNPDQYQSYIDSKYPQILQGAQAGNKQATDLRNALLRAGWSNPMDIAGADALYAQLTGPGGAYATPTFQLPGGTTADQWKSYLQQAEQTAGAGYVNTNI